MRATCPAHLTVLEAPQYGDLSNPLALPPRHKYSPQYTILKHPHPRSSLSLRDPNFYKCTKQRGKKLQSYKL
jgi:hypothetical protein